MGKLLSRNLHTKYRILDFKIKECKLLNSTAIASGYAGRDPQGGTSDGSFFSKFSFKIQMMVKILLLVLVKKKRKIRLKWVREKVVEWEDGENRSDMYKENERVKEIWVIMVLVIYTKL